MSGIVDLDKEARENAKIIREMNRDQERATMRQWPIITLVAFIATLVAGVVVGVVAGKTF